MQHFNQRKQCNSFFKRDKQVHLHPCLGSFSSDEIDKFMQINNIPNRIHRFEDFVNLKKVKFT